MTSEQSFTIFTYTNLEEVVMFPGKILVNGSAKHPLAIALRRLHAQSFTYHNIHCHNLQSFLLALTCPHTALQADLFDRPAKVVRKRLRTFCPNRFHYLLFENTWLYRRGTEYAKLLDAVYDTLYEQSPDIAQSLRSESGSGVTVTIKRTKLSLVPIRAAEVLRQCQRLCDRARSEAPTSEAASA